MAEPDSLTFDPSRTPFTSPAPRFTYIQHMPGGTIKVNTDTHEVVPLPQQMYPSMPLKLPKELTDIDQPVIRTCSVPAARNKGCEAAINGGCPIIQRYGRGCGPFNLIVERNGVVDSAPCFATYCGMTDSGRPASQVHLLMDGWQILTDRTAVKQRTADMSGGAKVIREFLSEVPDLAPFYEEAKVGRFAAVAPAPKKRGRPRKDATAGV